MWRQILLALALVMVAQAKAKRKFCKNFKIKPCIAGKIKANPGRLRRVMGESGILAGCVIGGTPKKPEYDYDCIDNHLKRCDGAAVDVFLTLYDQSVCMELNDCDNACEGKLEKAMLAAGVDCGGVRLLSQTMKELPNHCQATEDAGRITGANGAHFKQLLLSLLPAINDPEKFFNGLENFNMLDIAGDLVFVDNEQMNIDPKTRHDMFGHFVGNDISERTAAHAVDYSFAPSQNDKMWVATPTIVEEWDFISLGEDPTDASKWESMFVGDTALIVVYRNLQICKVSTGKCMLYKIGVFVATAKDITNTATTTGLIHYSPYAAPYSCLLEEGEEGHYCPDGVEVHSYGTDHIKVDEETGVVDIDNEVDIIGEDGEVDEEREEEPDKGDL